MKPFRETELLKLLEETARSAPSRNLTNDGSGISPEPATTDNAFTSQNNVDAPLMDLSLLNAMTYGDREQIRKILDRFVEDTGNDINQIYHSMERSEEHTSELQSLMRISYAVFCLKKKKK